MSSGKISRPYNDLDTDQIATSQYLLLPAIEEMRVHTSESLNPGLSEKVKPGDSVVGGENFGCDSSREQTPNTLKASRVRAVITKFFVRIFYRNAISISLPVIVCKEPPDHAETGDETELSLSDGVARTGGVKYTCTKLPEYM